MPFEVHLIFSFRRRISLSVKYMKKLNLCLCWSLRQDIMTADLFKKILERRDFEHMANRLTEDSINKFKNKQSILIACCSIC